MTIHWANFLLDNLHYIIGFAFGVIIALTPIPNPHGAICIITTTSQAPNTIINHTHTILGNITTTTYTTSIQWGNC